MGTGGAIGAWLGGFMRDLNGAYEKRFAGCCCSLAGRHDAVYFGAQNC